MTVVQIFRHPHERFFSIESVFSRVRHAWPDKDLPEMLQLPVSGFSIKNILATREMVRRFPNAVFHVTGDAHYVVLALPRKRTILTIHDAVFLEQHRGWRRWILKLIFLDIPVRYSKYITTISEKSKAEILRHTPCPESRIRVIPNPVSPTIFFRPQPFRSDCPMLLFVGVKPNKNLERVCEALNGLSCKLVIIGKLFPHQLDLLKRHGISHESMHGITEEEMAEQYARADLILFPSLYEGFGLPVIEGFRAGRAVVTSNLSPMKDIAQDGACLVDPLEVSSIRAGLQRVIEDQAYRDRLIQRGFELVSSYAPEAIARQYHSLYQQIDAS